MKSQVKKETLRLRSCLSCPLCDNILRDATTISECLHTFCRKCIYEKITEDEIDCCPVCNIDLGGIPLEKLRPDHNLQDLRAKIFPLKRRKVKAPEPARRKKRSISALVVSTPKRSTQAGKRRKFFGERTVKKEDSSWDDELLSYADSLPGEESKDGDEEWKPLNYLVEVANRTKALKSSASQGSGSKPEHGNASRSKLEQNKKKAKDQKRQCEWEDERSNNCDPQASETAKAKRPHRTQRKRSASTLGDSRKSQSRAKRERRNDPVWFSLVASTDQEGDTSLPQIPASFLRVRDGNIPVSFIQKYLMKKLNLESETEIEIRCMGDALIPTLKLQKLVDLWLQRSSKHQRFDAYIGSSAKDYMMVLVYARKLPECNK